MTASTLLSTPEIPVMLRAADTTAPVIASKSACFLTPFLKPKWISVLTLPS